MNIIHFREMRNGLSIKFLQTQTWRDFMEDKECEEKQGEAIRKVEENIGEVGITESKKKSFKKEK